MPIIPGANYDFGKVFADVVMRNQSMQNERAMNAERLALERARLDQQAAIQEQELEQRRAEIMTRLLSDREGRAFQAGEAEKGRQFQGGEAAQDRELRRGEAREGRQFAREERVSGQDFARGMAGDERTFRRDEAQAGREFARGERLGAQEFQSGEAGLAREHQQAMQDAQHVYNWLVTKAGWNQADAQRVAQEKFQTSMAAINFANQMALQEVTGAREDARAGRQLDYTRSRDAVNAAMGLTERYMQSNPLAQNADIIGMYNSVLGGLKEDLGGTRGGAPATPAAVPSTAKQQRETQLKERKAKQEDIDALIAAYDEGLRSPNADGTRGNFLGSIGRFGYGLGRNALKTMTLGLSGYLYPSPQEHAIKNYGAQAEEYMLGSGYTPEQVEMARKASLNKNRLGF